MQNEPKSTMSSALPVHPMADIFPMMPDDEIAALAESIKTNGLIHPIVLGEWTDDDGNVVEGLIDGRNRIRACEIAEVEPTYTKLNGHDPRAFIAAVNLDRRNLTAGQKAMALATLYPEPERGRGKKDEAEKAADSADFSRRRLRQARQVLRESRTLAQSVLSGAVGLDAALAECSKRTEADAKPIDDVEQLRRRYVDLAEKVVEGELGIKEAQAEASDRDAAEHNKRETYIRLADAAYRGVKAFVSDEFVEGIRERLDDDAFRSAMLDRLLIDAKPTQLKSEIHDGAVALAALLGELLRAPKGRDDE